LGDIVSAANHPAGGKQVRLQGRTKHGNATGTCMIRCEEMANQNGVVTLRFRAKGLSNLDGMFGKSDPFLRMSRTREIGTPLPMFRSEVIMNNLNPKWAEIHVSLSALCNGDPYRTIEFNVADYDADGSHDFIGKCTASLNDLLSSVGNGGNPKEMQLKNNKNGKKSGTLICTMAKVAYEPSFLDYIMGGTEVNFMVAVDFTASNRRQDQPDSLHYISQQPNQYQQAIQRVGDVLEFYDNDKQFPTWGFGGVVQQGGRAEHCFNLVQGGPNATAAGVQGIMNAYNQAVQSVQLSGPTIFSQVLETAAGIATSGMDGSQYFVSCCCTNDFANQCINCSTKTIKTLFWLLFTDCLLTTFTIITFTTGYWLLVTCYLLLVTCCLDTTFTKQVLLILTDGEITDMDNTRNAIIRACNLPISILIVGVGSCEFEKMNLLDGDDGTLTASDGYTKAR
jgi:hypothetical protein